jgi:hypothetical protein
MTKMDMDSQKVKESNPPSFRPAEVGGPGRGFVGLNRVFESTILGLWDGFAPVVQPTAWRERERKKENRERERSRWEKETFAQPRRSPSLSLLSLFQPIHTAKITNKNCAQILALVCLDRCSRAAETRLLAHNSVRAGRVGDPTAIIIYLISCVR